MKRLLFIPLLLGTFTGCPKDPQDATCVDVCTHAAILECVSAKPTAKGATCVEVCENLQNSGLPKWNLPCRAAAASCAASCIF